MIEVREGIDDRGKRVWVLAHGWWRRGRVVAKLRKKVIVEYCLQDGIIKQTRRELDSRGLQPENFDGISLQAHANRPLAMRGLWDPS